MGYAPGAWEVEGRDALIPLKLASSVPLHAAGPALGSPLQGAGGGARRSHKAEGCQVACPTCALYSGSSLGQRGLEPGEVVLAEARSSEV